MQKKIPEKNGRIKGFTNHNSLLVEEITYWNNIQYFIGLNRNNLFFK